LAKIVYCRFHLTTLIVDLTDIVLCNAQIFMSLSQCSFLLYSCSLEIKCERLFMASLVVVYQGNVVKSEG
jgi:hypothetical protein